MSAIQQLLNEHLDIWTAADTGPKSSRGRSSSNAASVYGIRKLRELILELAVRGKLVPQDADDEPARELLKRIQAEKAKLITEGNIKKEKPLPPIMDSEKPFDLPGNWEWCRFGDLVNITTGKLDANAAVDNGKYPFFTCSQTPSKINTYSFDTSAVLLAGNGDFNVKYYQGKFDAYQRTYVIEPIIFGLKFCFLLASAQIKVITKNNRGSAIPYLKMGDLTNPVFALPPLAEQRRIVAKVDELMALCDQLEAEHNNASAAHEKLVSELLATLARSHVHGAPVPQGDYLRGIEPRPSMASTSSPSGRTEFEENWQRIAAHFDTLFTTEASIDALKQTLLQLAVMGKLVPQDPNDEPASDLLKRIQAEKSKLIAEGRIKKDKSLLPIAEYEKPYELPHGWEWVRLGTIGLTATGGTPKTANHDFIGGDLPFIGPGQIHGTGHISNPEKWLSDTARAETTVTEPGDILMVCIGGSIGKSAIADREMAFNQQINSIRVLLASYDYVFNAVSESRFQSSVWESSTGSATPIINRSKWDCLVIPLPPLKEQHRIVVKIGELMALCNQLKSRVIEVSQLRRALADVLVEKAVV